MDRFDKNFYKGDIDLCCEVPGQRVKCGGWYMIWKLKYYIRQNLSCK